MISLTQAARQGISLLRREVWEPNSRIELHLVPNGGHGPWVKLHSLEPTRNLLFTAFDWDEEEWMPWTPEGEDDEDEETDDED